MVYRRRAGRRRYGRRRTYGRRKVYRRRRFNPRMVSLLPRRSVELKFFDNNATNVALSVGGAFLFSSINVIPQGVDQDDRIGRLITIKSIMLNGQLIKVSDSAGASNRVRFLIVWDKQNSGGSGANLNDVINPVVDGMRDPPNQSRFVVLKSWLVCLNAMSGAFEGKGSMFGQTCKMLRWYKKCNIPIEYDGSTGAITEITTNNLFIAAWMESASPAVLTTFQVRVRFTDT